MIDGSLRDSGFTLLETMVAFVVAAAAMLAALQLLSASAGLLASADKMRAQTFDLFEQLASGQAKRHVLAVEGEGVPYMPPVELWRVQTTEGRRIEVWQMHSPAANNPAEP